MTVNPAAGSDITYQVERGGREGKDGDRESVDSEVKSHFTPVYNRHYLCISEHCQD